MELAIGSLCEDALFENLIEDEQLAFLLNFNPLDPFFLPLEKAIHWRKAGQDRSFYLFFSEHSCLTANEIGKRMDRHAPLLNTLVLFDPPEGASLADVELPFFVEYKGQVQLERALKNPVFQGVLVQVDTEDKSMDETLNQLDELDELLQRNAKGKKIMIQSTLEQGELFLLNPLPQTCSTLVCVADEKMIIDYRRLAHLSVHQSIEKLQHHLSKQRDTKGVRE